MSINRSIADLLRSHATIPTAAAAAAPGANLLINGAFTVAQRGTSFDIDPNASGTDEYYTLDRWNLYAYLVDADYTVTQETLTPGTDEPYDHGFRHSIKVNCDVASASPALLTRWHSPRSWKVRMSNLLLTGTHRQKPPPLVSGTSTQKQAPIV